MATTPQPATPAPQPQPTAAAAPPASATQQAPTEARAKTTAEKAAADKATEEEMQARAAGSIGAQIILDYNGEGSLGARGGLHATIEENTAARDAHLISVGLDPNNPSGPPTGEPWVPPAPPDQPAVMHQPASGQATRMSSLAAGAVTGDREPPPPPDTVTGGLSRR